MMSLQTTADAPPCSGFIAANEKDPDALKFPIVREIPSFAPKPTRKKLDPTKQYTGMGPDPANDPYSPHVFGAKKTTSCPVSDQALQVPGLPTRHDCRKPPQGKIASPCTDGTPPPLFTDPNNAEYNCAVTVIDHFTSSFHWAHGNVSAIWLRPLWYLVT